MAVAVAVPVPEEEKTAVVNPGDNNGGGDGGGGGGDLRKDIQVVHGARQGKFPLVNRLRAYQGDQEVRVHPLFPVARLP